MALPTVWQLLIPNFNAATIVGILLLLLAIFGGPVFRLIGTIVSKLSGGRIGDNFITSILVIGGLILVWGVSIAQDLANSREFLLIAAGVLFLVAIFIFAFNTRDNPGVFK